MTQSIGISCSKSTPNASVGGNVPVSTLKIDYNPTLDYIEAEHASNPYGTRYKSPAPIFIEGSLQGKEFSIKSVDPASEREKFYIEKTTGEIYVKEHHGFKLGQRYVVSVSVTDTETRQRVDFDNIFTLGVMDFPDKILYNFNFEGNSPLKNLSAYNANVSVCADPLDATNKVLKSHLPDGEYRTEAVVGNSGIHRFYCDLDDKSHGGEIWVGFRILKPAYNNYVGTNYRFSVFQIGPIDSTDPAIINEASAGHYQFQMSMSANPKAWFLREFTSIYNPNQTLKSLAAIDDGQWGRVVMHCVFSADNSKGLIQIWINDQLRYQQQRQNGIALSNTRIQFGLYMGAENYNHTPIDCYYDDVTIGNATASYQDVVPKS